MFENNLWTMEPIGRPENTIQGDKYRFTLLTPCLIRMEYREDGKFEDRPTQVVWNRKFDPVDFRVEKKDEGFELFTDRMHVTYTGGPFTKNSLNLNAVGVHVHIGNENHSRKFILLAEIPCLLGTNLYPCLT